MIGFRNIAVHAYFSIDWSIVWATVTKDLAALRATAAEILESLPPTP